VFEFSLNPLEEFCFVLLIRNGGSFFHKFKLGRIQILGIHTQKMRENKKLGTDVDLHILASKTKNFSGAEIEV
jgi:hypothetical protein